MRRLCSVMLISALSSIVCLGATESLRNDSGKTAIGVTITFSEKVRVTSYDTAVFPDQDPTGRAQSFTFSGGALTTRGRFAISWTPSTASIAAIEWRQSPSAAQLSSRISDLLAPYELTDLPVLQEWSGDEDLTYGMIPLATGSWTDLSAPYAKLEAGDWAISSVKGGVLETSIIFRIEFSPGGRPSRTPEVEYQIGIIDYPASILLSPGCDVGPRVYTASSDVEVPMEYQTVGATALTVAVPFTYLTQAGVAPQEVLGKKVWLAVKYREETIHYFLECQQSSSLMAEVMSPAEIAAAAAAAAKALEIPGLEYLGNPLAERLPDGSGWETARRVWDMQTFGERIYLGHGDITSNSGPTPVWYWDCALEMFVQEFTMDDEAILAFRVVGDEMLVPGSDATESWDLGNVYVHDGSAWTKIRTLPHALHVSSFYRFDGDLFATITDDVQRWVLRSADDGQTWSVAYDDKNITTTQLFSFGGQLYLSWMKESGVLRYDGQTFSAVEGLSMFPGAPFYEEPRMGYGMHAFETFGTDLVYIGRTMYFIHSSAYVMHETTQDCIDALPVGEPTTMTVATTDGAEWRRDVQVQGEEPYDIAVEDERCWILTNEMHADDVAATVRVYSSTDLVTWARVLEFEAPTVANSFEVHGAYIYFGLGAGHPHTQTYASWGSAHPAAGRIYRYALP